MSRGELSLGPKVSRPARPELLSDGRGPSAFRPPFSRALRSREPVPCSRTDLKVGKIENKCVIDGRLFTIRLL